MSTVMTFIKQFADRIPHLLFGWKVGFNQPWFLLLLLLVPLLWWFSFRSLAGLGRIRRLAALGLRTVIVVAFVLALAEVQLLRVSEKMTVMYLLDQSESIPLAKRQLMLDYVVKEVQAHRDANREDRAGVIVFGLEASIEIPPFPDDVHTVGLVESLLGRTDATNLAAALKLAQASFPEDTAKRIVVVTDGNENVGDARSVAPLLAEHGIGIDVVPVKLSTSAEVAMEKLVLPSDIRRGQPIEARAVINVYMEQPVGKDGKPKTVSGKLRIIRKSGKIEELLAEEAVELQAGKNVFPFQHTINEPAAYTYEADFTPDKGDDDLLKQNNKATSFTHVRGKGRVLFIVDAAAETEFDFLISRLRTNNIEIAVQRSDELFTSLAELQAYDSVVLANVPRTSGEDASVTGFSDEQIDILVRNTQQMGCGLVMLGGPNSFGAGGWSGTELEKAMPVDFQIKNDKIEAVGALAMLMHATELAQGNYWQKVIAREAIKTLGPMDYCGVLHYGMGGDEWLWGGNVGLIRIGQQQKRMLAKIESMTPGDMPQFDTALRLALAGFNRVTASAKHMILISDGDPAPPSPTTIAAFRAASIPISTIAVGTHGPAGSTPLQMIATATGGKYYVATNPKALPKIFQREARRVAKPLIYEPGHAMQPQIKYPHEALQGIDGPLPPINGFVMTTLKENPLVEVALRSPEPDESNATILAAWTYGLGRTAALTTDVGQRWSKSWTEWDNYDKLFSQLIRWSMRPVSENEKFSIATDIKDGKVRVVLTALDKEDQFLNFLNAAGSAVSPDLQASELKLQQVAPGRYVGEFDATKSGSYFLTIHPGAGYSLLTTGVSVPYSDEFRIRPTNLPLLESLAGQKPKGGDAGKVISGELQEVKMERLLSVNTFRRTLAKAVSSQDVWPLVLLISSCIFFTDVFVRRVTIGFEWLTPVVAWVNEKVFRRERAAAVDDRLSRLRSRKAAVASQIDERRAATRFDPQPDADLPAAGQNLDQVLQDLAGGTPPPPPVRATSTSMTPVAEEDTYTARLLKAKERAKKQNET